MIELGDGLQLEELLEICERLDVKRLLSPDLVRRLVSGCDAALSIEPMINMLPPFLLGLVPLPPGWRDKLRDAADAARLLKAVLD